MKAMTITTIGPSTRSKGRNKRSFLLATLRIVRQCLSVMGEYLHRTMVRGYVKGGFMADMWRVVSNSGQHAVFERGNERIDINCPKDTFAKEMFIKNTSPGSLVDDGVIELFTRKPVATKRRPKR
jgi:hypothetical protein